MDTLEQSRKDRKEKGKTKNKLYPLSILLAVITLLSLCCCIILILLQMKQLPQTVETVSTEEEVTYTQEELDLILAEARETASFDARNELKTELKSAYMSGEGVINELRDLYPEDIIFYDSNHYSFTPISDLVPATQISNQNLVVRENGWIEYAPDNFTVSHTGIDVSKYQGEIDWNKVAASGIEYAIIRLGIRGYGTGEIVADEQFESNIKGALAAGLDVGVYFFTQAISEEEAIEEANFVLETIAPYQVTYPVIIDVEVLYDSEARTYQLTPAQRTDYTIAFCDTVKAAGYTPMIYGNLKSFCSMLDITRLNDYDKWFAFYDSYIYFPYEISMWQYTDTAVIDGIDGPVDLNITFEQKWGSNAATP